MHLEPTTLSTSINVTQDISFFSVPRSGPIAGPLTESLVHPPCCVKLKHDEHDETQCGTKKSDKCLTLGSYGDMAPVRSVRIFTNEPKAKLCRILHFARLLEMLLGATWDVSFDLAGGTRRRGDEPPSVRRRRVGKNVISFRPCIDCYFNGFLEILVLHACLYVRPCTR